MALPQFADAAAEAREDYLMDLRGYRILPGVLTAHELAELTAWLDEKGSDSAKTLPVPILAHFLRPFELSFGFLGWWAHFRCMIAGRHLARQRRAA